MTQAQVDAHLCGSSPEEHEPRFIAQLMRAYVFARPLAKHRRVLEVGFGEGYGAHYLAEVAHEVTGIDTAPGNVLRSAEKYRRSNLTFVHMDATQMAFPDSSFDLVCSFQVIEHIPEPQLVPYLSEINRVLRPDGQLCVSTLNLASAMKPGKPYKKLQYHEKEFTAPELAALLQRVFPSVELYGLHLAWTHRLHQRLKRWGIDRLGPKQLNPVTRFYASVSPKDFTVSRDVSRSALDLYGVCRKHPAHGRSASCPT